MKHHVILVTADGHAPKDLLREVADLEGVRPAVTTVAGLHDLVQKRELPLRVWVDPVDLPRFRPIVRLGGTIVGSDLAGRFAIDIPLFDPRFGEIDPDTTGGFIGFGNHPQMLDALANQVYHGVAVGRLFQPGTMTAIGTLLMDRANDPSRPWGSLADCWHFKNNHPFPQGGFEVAIGNAASGAWQSDIGEYHRWADQQLQARSLPIPPISGQTTRYKIEEIPAGGGAPVQHAVWMQVTPFGDRFVQDWYAEGSALSSGRFVMGSTNRYRFTPTNATLAGLSNPQSVHLGVSQLLPLG